MPDVKATQRQSVSVKCPSIACPCRHCCHYYNCHNYDTDTKPPERSDTEPILNTYPGTNDPIDSCFSDLFYDPFDSPSTDANNYGLRYNSRYETYDSYVELLLRRTEREIEALARESGANSEFESFQSSDSEAHKVESVPLRSVPVSIRAEPKKYESQHFPRFRDHKKFETEAITSVPVAPKQSQNSSQLNWKHFNGDGEDF